MSISPAMETFFIGMLCGAVLGAAAVLSRWLLAAAFAIAAALIVFLLIDQGVPGLESEIGRLIDEALRHRHLASGALIGILLAASLFDRLTPRTGRGRD